MFGVSSLGVRGFALGGQDVAFGVRGIRRSGFRVRGFWGFALGVRGFLYGVRRFVFGVWGIRVPRSVLSGFALGIRGFHGSGFQVRGFHGFPFQGFRVSGFRASVFRVCIFGVWVSRFAVWHSGINVFGVSR